MILLGRPNFTSTVYREKQHNDHQQVKQSGGVSVRRIKNPRQVLKLGLCCTSAGLAPINQNLILGGDSLVRDLYRGTKILPALTTL